MLLMVRLSISSQSMLPDKIPFQESLENKPKRWSGCSYLGLAGILLLILSCIALPYILNQANKAKAQRSQGIGIVSYVNRAQQAVFLENGTFANSSEALGIGLPYKTEFYSYLVGIQPAQPPIAVTLAVPAQEGLKGYLGIVFLTSEEGVASLATNAIICETEANISANFPMPLPFPNASMECPAGFVKR